MEKWLQESLSKCLDCVVNEKMMQAIMSIKDEESFDNYFGNLLSKDCEEHRLFMINCKRMLLGGKVNKSSSPNEKPTAPKSTAKPQQKQPHVGSSTIMQCGANSGATSKKKTKFVSLYAKDGKVVGDTILLKGRRICHCQAAQHKLINNCLSCGRIICEQEGSGPCLFCGEPVYSTEEEQSMQNSKPVENHNKPNKISQTHLIENKEQTVKTKKLTSSTDRTSPPGSNLAKDSNGLKQAMAQRDRLLDYDRNSEKRTTIIDDEFDYFQENSVWLSNEEREKFESLQKEMHDMKHAGRAKRKIKIDFAGRELPDEPISQAYEQEVLRQLTATTQNSNSISSSSGIQRGLSELSLAPNILQQPLYKPTQPKSIVKQQNEGLEHIYNRVQDKELLEMQDLRQCLSMHQPWASLLVAGIKKHEGRVWYSEHRGRLWIASTVKEPKPEDIADLEQFYRLHLNDGNIKFPEHYPTSSLLGCVTIEDCLPQEEYREQYPNGESDSPYVFICSHAEALPILLPVRGEPKIYELPIKTHNTACKILLRARVSKG